MEPRKIQVIIVNTRTEPFPWSTPANPIQKCRIVLYDSSDQKIKTAALISLNEDNPSPDVLRRVEHALKTSSSQTFINLESTFDNKNAVCKMWTRMTFDHDLLKALQKTLVEPTIKIFSKFSTANIPFKTETILSTINHIEDFESAVQTFPASQFPPACRLDKITYFVLLEWKEQATSRKNQCNVLGSLLKDKTLTDCCIRSAENTEIKCHGNILAANSDVFHAMLTSGFEESQTKVIEMTDVSDKTVNELLAYLYGIEINPLKMKEEMAFNLLRVGHKYNISSLEKDMLETLLNKPDDGFNMDTVLELYLFTVNIDQFSHLCEKTLNILMRNPKTLVSSPAYKDFLKSNAEDAAKLALKLLELGLN